MVSRRIYGSLPGLLLALTLAGAWPHCLCAEDGYQLWLRYRPVLETARLAQFRQAATGILVQGQSPTAEANRQELHRGLSGLLNGDVPLISQASQPGAIIVGTPTNSPVVAALNWGRDLQAQGDEGFLIRTTTLDGKAATVIASNGELGALYGTFHFLRLLQTGQDVTKLTVAEKPRLQRRLLDHWDNLDGTIERGYAGRSLWKWDELPGTLDPRYVDDARADASLGINGAVLNNVNASAEQLAPDNLKKAAALANVYRPYGVRVYLSANFAAPKVIGGLATADPLDPAVQGWWKQKVDEIYGLIPDFGGFVVKANSEGQPGPQDYHRTHADGANVLADALAPHHGIVMWRAFVYSDRADRDRVKRAYAEFQPLDGQFRANVMVQVKNGPLDFQPREPFHPLFGAMPRTPLMAEVQITQEYLGQDTHLVYLGPMWKEFLTADTSSHGKGSTVASILEAYPITGICGVANVGSDRNWCGQDFAQANWYAFGRLAWNDGLSADAIAEEWTRMTWGNQPEVVRTIGAMMHGSREAFVDYETPLGLHHLIGSNHYEPSLRTRGEFHHADQTGVGASRDKGGSNAVGQYFPPVRDQFDNLATCPDNLLLWFHHVGWDHKTHSGRSVWDEMCFRYNRGVDYVKGMQAEWKSLQGQVDPERYAAVEKRLADQLADAMLWRDASLRYFGGINHLPVPQDPPAQP